MMKKTAIKRVTRMSLCLLLALATLLPTLALAGCGEPDPEPVDPNAPVADPVDDNYRTFYQIFVGSFADSNGDGFGDLGGIIERMDYLNDGNLNSDTSLGVQGIWLSPIFSSPSYHKYDAKDYYQVDWRFGTEETLKELIDLCHERNIKIILDLAINHTSSQHEWFLKFKEARISGNTEDPYYDFYTCVTNSERVNGIQYQGFGGGWFYECNFSGDMPELNYDNPDVREAMLDVAKYYMDLGIDGFRFDAVKYIYYGDTARSVDFWKWYMSELRAIDPDVYCVGECWSAESEILEYYPAMNCFNFAMSQAEGKVAMVAKGVGSVKGYTDYIQSLQERIREKNPDGMVMGFLSNHDMDRIAGVFISENNMRVAANLYLLCAGSPVIYYGEEIGIRGSRGGANTDANRRLAMLWGDGYVLRDPVGANYSSDYQIKTTVVDQMADEGSLLRYYCRLLTIRHKYEAIARGTYTSLEHSKKFGGFLVTYEGETLGIFHNTGIEAVTVDLAEYAEAWGYTFTELCEQIGVDTATLDGTVLTVGPQTSVILK